MNEIVNITEDKLHRELKRFDNKNINISFNGYLAEYIILKDVRIKKKNFTLILRSKATDELFAINLCDIYNIKKTIDNKVLYLYSEIVGKIKIEINNKIYATI